jgi:hypothetical protein
MFTGLVRDELRQRQQRYDNDNVVYNSGNIVFVNVVGNDGFSHTATTVLLSDVI